MTKPPPELAPNTIRMLVTIDFTSTCLIVNSESYCWILTAFSVYRNAVWVISNSGIEQAPASLLDRGFKVLFPMLYQWGNSCPSHHRFELISTMKSAALLSNQCNDS